MTTTFRRFIPSLLILPVLLLAAPTFAQAGACTNVTITPVKVTSGTKYALNVASFSGVTTDRWLAYGSYQANVTYNGVSQSITDTCTQANSSPVTADTCEHSTSYTVNGATFVISSHSSSPPVADWPAPPYQAPFSGSGTVTCTAPTVNGVCSSTHYSCSAGTSTNNVDGSTSYTWTCAGANGGTSASCSETKSLPDLTAGAISPTTATPGTPVTFSATISNIGTASTGASFSNFMQVATAANGGGTITDLTSVAMSALGVSGTGQTSKSYTFASAGTYSLRACADKSSNTNTGTITESNESNNCGPWTTITVSASAVNGVCASTHYSCSAGTSTNNVNGTTSYTWTCTGTNGGSSASCSEAKSLPDVTAGAITPTTVTPGVSATFSATISNIGTASTGASFTNFLQVRTSSGGKFSTDTTTDLVGTSMATLAAGGTNTTSQSYTFASAGTYTMRACADKSSSTNLGTITESDETNNCGPWTTITVTSSAINGVCASTHYNCSAGTSTNNVDGATSYTWTCAGTGGGSSASCSETKTLPDVTAGAVSPTSAVSGASTVFSATISNIGTASTGASFSNFMQVATAANGGGTITDLAATTMATLAASANNTTSQSYTFASAGTYSLRACADKSSSTNLGVVTESDENNNCGAWTTITISSGGDANGVCASTHYNCSAGTSANNVEGKTNYTWDCVGTNSTASCSELISSPPPTPPTATLNASPATIVSGASSTLTWSSTDATTCVAAGGFSTGNATSGSVSVSPTSTSNYQITCSGAGSPPATANATVTVTDPTVSITAAPPLVRTGNDSVITWSSVDTKNCVVSGPGLSSTATAGSQTVTITTQSTYRITCDSVPTQSVTVNVTPGFQEF